MPGFLVIEFSAYAAPVQEHLGQSRTRLAQFRTTGLGNQGQIGGRKCFQRRITNHMASS